MSNLRKFGKNTAVLFISQMLSYIIRFLFSAYAGRYLGAKLFGILSTAIALTEIARGFADFGLKDLILREVPRHKDMTPKYMDNTISFK